MRKIAVQERRLLHFVVCGGVASQTSQLTAARKKRISPHLNIMHQKIVRRVCNFQLIGCVARNIYYNILTNKLYL